MFTQIYEVNTMYITEKNSHHPVLNSLGDAAARTAATILVILFALLAAQPLLFLDMLL